MDFSNAQRAEVLTQALPYIQKYYGKTIVVKYGGNAMINDDLRQQVMEDIILLSLVGVKVVLVHGGGPEITDMLKRVGKESMFVEGLRVTDKETAEIVQMVLAGKTNKDLVNLLQIKGGKALGLSGIDNRMIEAEPKDERLGFVGRIVRVNVEPITDLLEKGYIPVVSTVGCDRQGNAYNINADTAAAYIAGAMNAERMILMTDIAGILRDREDDSSLIDCLNTAQLRSLLEDGTLAGGMIPKAECCLEAIAHGVKIVIIMDGRVPHSLLIETLTNEGAGTMVTGEETNVH
ncbi:MAG: acetylglutamate kinase [Clostridia bacterium]|nr:acetylglutamate kinase [Clostridia bacterium]